VPRHLTGAAGLHREAFTEQLTTPLPADVVDEMRWYFHACRDNGVDLDERYYRAQTAFAGPRFRAMYRRWLMDGERVLDAAMSGVLVDVVARRGGVLESPRRRWDHYSRMNPSRSSAWRASRRSCGCWRGTYCHAARAPVRRSRCRMSSCLPVSRQARPA
jgi:hypothetical protein